MSDTQKEILKMLADQVITVDEAERLLKAVNEGEHQKEESKSRTCGHRGMGGIFDYMGEAFSEIGPLMKETVEDVMSGLFGSDSDDFREDELKDIEPVDGKYAIDAGTHMTILNNWKVGGLQSDLVIEGVEGDFCQISEDTAKNAKVQRNSAHIVVRWSGGPLKIDVPETVSLLNVKTKGGNIHSTGLRSEMSLKTFGGSVELSDLTKDFKAKTLGGNLTLRLSPEWEGNGQAFTKGGNITLALPDDVSSTIEASAIGGTTKIDKEIRQMESTPFSPGKSKITVQVGAKHLDSRISLKTMGGDIEIRKVQDDDSRTDRDDA